jgi:predicted Zn-dependent peptidase
LNAYTGRETTAYYAKVLAEDIGLGVDLVSDILQHSQFDEQELVRERAVVLQEIGQANDTPDDIIFDHFQEAAYPDQPVGRPVLGRADVVKRLGRADLVDYQGRRYGAERMIFSAAGRIEHDRIVDLVDRAFGDLQRHSDALTDAAAYVGGDYREHRGLEQVHLILGFDGLGFKDSDFYAGSVLSTLLGGGMSSRLFQEIRERRGLVYTIFSFLSAQSDSGLFGVYAGTGEEEAAELLPVVISEMQALVEKGVGEDEVARAKAQLKASILMGRERTSGRAEHLANQMLVYGRPLGVQEVVDKILAVDAAAVRRVAERLLTGSRPTLTALGPTGRVESYDRVLDRLGPGREVTRPAVL